MCMATSPQLLDQPLVSFGRFVLPISIDIEVRRRRHFPGCAVAEALVQAARVGVVQPDSDAELTRLAACLLSGANDRRADTSTPVRVRHVKTTQLAEWCKDNLAVPHRGIVNPRCEKERLASILTSEQSLRDPGAGMLCCGDRSNVVGSAEAHDKVFRATLGARGHATFNGVIDAICTPARSSASSSSNRVCRFSQNWGSTPK